MKQKIYNRIIMHVRSRYTMVDVLPKAGLFNYKCFDNAVEFSRTNEGFEVVEVIYIEDSMPILHYVNREVSTGLLYETTLGYRATKLEYYAIRTIHLSDHSGIRSEFNRSLESWLFQFTNPFQRFFFRIKRVV
jgi:hypothetical protein